MSEFKVGDKVYLPALGAAVYQVKENGVFDPMFYPLKVVDAVGAMIVFTKKGRIRNNDGLPDVFHATEKNHAKMEAFYEVEFEKPPVKPTSKDIIQAMLERGDKCVPCWLSDYKENPTTDDQWDYAYYVEDGEKIIDVDGHAWRYATPFDHTTGQPITELPE